MTQQERMNILSREILRVPDVMALFDCKESQAYKIIREIKSTHDRLKISGVVHIQDYLEKFNLPVERYVVTVVAERDKDDKIKFV